MTGSKRIKYVWIILLLPVTLFSQEKLPNEVLLKKISETTVDSVRAKNYYQLAKNYLRTSADTCMFYAQEALHYATKWGNKKLLAETYSILGSREKSNGHYEASIQYHLKAMSFREAMNDTYGMAIGYNDMGILYKNLNRYREALTYYQKSNEYARQCGKGVAISMTFSNIGTVYSALKKMDSARIFYDTALHIATQIKDTGSIVNALANLGEYYGLIGKTDEAKQCFEKSLILDRAIGDKYGEVLDLTNLANLITGAKDFSSAQIKYSEAERIAIQEKLLKELIDLYSSRSHSYKEMGDYKHALLYQIKSDDLKDSVMNSETNEKVIELHTKYETAKKEKTIAEQASSIQRSRFMLISSAFLLCFVGLAAWYRYKKLKAEDAFKLKEAVHEQQMLATRSVMEAEEKERQRIATELHDGVGQLMTAAKLNLSALESDLEWKEPERKESFQRILDLISESGKEVREVAHNLMPNVLLKKGLSNAVQEFLNKIDSKVIQVHLHADGIHDKMDPAVETVLYRVIQECVNNVIKHSKASRLDMGISHDQEGVSISIEDNGIGFDVRKIKSGGIGLTSMKTRIEYLNGQLDIDSTPGHGTLVAIFVPYKKYDV